MHPATRSVAVLLLGAGRRPTGPRPSISCGSGMASPASTSPSTGVARNSTLSVPSRDVSRSIAVDSRSAFTPSVLEMWRRRENLLPGLVLIVLAAAGWAYVAYQAATMGSPMGSMRSVVGGMAMGGIGGAAPFLSGWTAMMVAMMGPATLPLILLYRHLARKRLGPARSRIGTVLLLVGYVAVWAVAGLPGFAYNAFSSAVGSLAAVLPALLLIVGGPSQFTPLKRICHTRCSSPLFFLMQNWRPGATGAMRLGVIHGVDCLGCCAGLMAGLVALGMMNLAWMLTAAG